MVRQFCSFILSRRYYEIILLVLIGLSSCILALETPLDDPNSEKTRNIFYLDLIFSICFTTEIAMKIINKGLIFNGP